MPIPESEEIDATIQALGDLAHEHYLGSVGNKNARDGYEYAYDNEVINILDTPEARTLLTKLVMEASNKSYRQAISDVKYKGYGYDDGSGFILKISFKDLAELAALRKENGSDE